MIIVNIGFVYQLNILYIAIVKRKVLQIIFLYFSGFLYNSVVSVWNDIIVKIIPFFIEKGVVIQFFKLSTKIVN